MPSKKSIIEGKPEVKILKPDKRLFLPGEVGAMLSWTVSDPKTGKIIRQGEQKSKSYLQQFTQLLMVAMNMVPENTPIADIRDTSNTLKEVSHNYMTFLATALANDSTFGVQVGMDVTVPTITNYRLLNQCAHGVGLNQFQHGAVTFGLPTSDALKSYFVTTRVFTNGSGNPITVFELGLAVKANTPSPFTIATAPALTPGIFLILRDVVGGGIVVNNGQALTVNYQQQAAA